MLTTADVLLLGSEPIVRLSYQDVGSSILAFASVTLALGLATEPREPARAVATAAGIAGLVTMILDLFE